MNLRRYQTEARYQCNALLNGNRNPCLVLPTGTGKTKTACAIIYDRVSIGKRVYVLVPSVEIFNQWIASLSDIGINCGYINDEGIRGANRNVYVCMPLSLVNNLHQIPESIYPSELVVDEFQHHAADTWQKIKDFFPSAKILGLTATPRRTDGKTLSDCTDIVSTITMSEAVTDGYLAKPLVIVPQEFYSRIQIPETELDSASGLAKQAAELGQAQIIGDVIGSYSRVFCGLPVLVACSTHEHAQQMTEKFNAAGWKFEHIHSKLPAYKRAEMLKKIRAGKLNGLCTVGIGIEGMDIPGLYGLIWLRRTMSVTIYLQFIGRVLRPMKNKDYGVVLDFVGNLFIHGFPESQRNWTLDGKEQSEAEPIAPMKICPQCGIVNATENLCCHMCGFDFANGEITEGANKRKPPVMVDGRLVALTAEGEFEIENRIAAEKEKMSESEKSDIKPEKLESAEWLKGGLFAGRNRRILLQEAIKNLVR